MLIVTVIKRALHLFNPHRFAVFDSEAGSVVLPEISMLA